MSVHISVGGGRKYFGYFLLKTVGELLPSANCRIRTFGRIGKIFRNMCGKLYFVKCGNNVNIYKKAMISSRVELGNNSDIGYKARIQGRCLIGEYVMMGPECQIWTINHRHDSLALPMGLQGTEMEQVVIIEDNVWIGSRVIILPGVRIGEGSIIGAGAVVSRDIPPYSIAVGNPIKIVKKREEDYYGKGKDSNE